MSLILPKSIRVKLVSDGRPVRIKNVALWIKTSAIAKNDISLGPIFTDCEGIVYADNRKLRLLTSAVYASGLMDYKSIESAHEQVRISVPDYAAIERAILARSRTWNTLLAGEDELWPSIDDLINQLKEARRSPILPASIAAVWNNAEADFEYDLAVDYSSSIKRLFIEAKSKLRIFSGYKEA